MFQILYDTKRYYIRNAYTGILLSRHGKVKTFRSQKAAERYIKRINKTFRKTLRRLNK